MLLEIWMSLLLIFPPANSECLIFFEEHYFGLNEYTYHFSVAGKYPIVNQSTLLVEFASTYPHTLYLHEKRLGVYYIQDPETQLYFDSGDGVRMAVVEVPSASSEFKFVYCVENIWAVQALLTKSLLMNISSPTVWLDRTDYIGSKSEINYFFTGRVTNLPNCLMMSSTDLCHRCLPGYIRPNRSCVPGICNVPSCSLCSADDYCRFCNSGRRGNPIGTCTCSYIPHCATCDNSWKCLTCDPSFVLVGTACEPCDDKNCNTCSTKETCTICLTGFESLSGICMRKVKGLLCKLCDPQTQCWGYQPEDASMKDFSFSLCSESDCDLCKNTLDCTKCIQSPEPISKICPLMDCPRDSIYEVELSSSTVVHLEDFDCWDSDCKVCDHQNHCETCKSGFKTFLTVCVPDTNDYSSTTCTNCVFCQRFGAVVSNSVCEMTFCSVSNCSNCVNGNKCIKCKFGFVLTKLGCEKLPEVVCEYGYFESERICKLCTTSFTNCVSCSSIECLSCLEDFTLVNGHCEKPKCNVLNCVSCIDMRCEVCKDGFILLNGECEQESCLQCTQKTSCEKCSEGYVLFYQRCSTPCQIENCKNCLDGKCLECSDSYTLEENRCVSTTSCSISHCSECLNSKVCSRCEIDWELSNGLCFSRNCTSPCSLCDSQGSCYKFSSNT